MRLHVEVALQEEAHDLVVTETSAEVKRDVILVVLSVNWKKGEAGKLEKVLAFISKHRMLSASLSSGRSRLFLSWGS